MPAPITVPINGIPNWLITASTGELEIGLAIIEKTNQPSREHGSRGPQLNNIPSRALPIIITHNPIWPNFIGNPSRRADRNSKKQSEASKPVASQSLRSPFVLFRFDFINEIIMSSRKIDLLPGRTSGMSEW